MQEEADVGGWRGTSSQEKQEALTEDAGFLLRVFPRQRRYAELGYLLPFYLGPAVKTRCIGPSSWHALYLYAITVRIFGYASVGHGPEGAGVESRQSTRRQPSRCRFRSILTAPRGPENHRRFVGRTPPD